MGGVLRAEVPLRTLRRWLHEISVDEAEDEVAAFLRRTARGPFAFNRTGGTR